MQTRPWTRAEYDRLIEIGFLDEDEPIELLGGQLVVREPHCSPHATGVRLADEALRRVFGPGWDVRAGLPVALDEESEPEPDVCVVPGGPRTYRDAHPSRPVLIVEVALGSLAVDRHIKGSLYARAGIRDYWIVNLPERSRCTGAPSPTPPRRTTGATSTSRFSARRTSWRRWPTAAPPRFAVADLLP